MERTVAEILLGLGAVTLRADPPYRWASGILSPIYTDNRILLSFPPERKVIVDSMQCLMGMKKMRADVVAGVESSGIPWASWLADRTGLPLVYVRKAAKDHGRENLIEGKLEAGKRVLLVEDLVSTGQSSVAAVEALRDAGAVVEDCMAIFSYGLGTARERFRSACCRLSTLTDFPTLIKVAAELGTLRKEDMEGVLEWAEDPEAWGASRRPASGPDA